MNYENLSVDEKVAIRELLKEQVEKGFVNKPINFNVKIYLEAIKVAVLANCPDGIDDTLFGQKVDVSNPLFQARAFIALVKSGFPVQLGIKGTYGTMIKTINKRYIPKKLLMGSQ